MALAPGSPSEQLLDALLNVSDFNASGVLGFLGSVITQPLSLILTSLGLSYATLLMWSLVIFAVLKQLALIAMIVLTPVAIVAMVFDKSQCPAPIVRRQDPDTASVAAT